MRGFRRVAPMTGHENDGLIRIAYNIWCALEPLPNSSVFSFICIVIYIIVLPHTTFFLHTTPCIWPYMLFDLDLYFSNVGLSPKHVYQTVLLFLCSLHNSAHAVMEFQSVNNGGDYHSKCEINFSWILVYYEKGMFHNHNKFTIYSLL